MVKQAVDKSCGREICSVVNGEFQAGNATGGRGEWGGVSGGNIIGGRMTPRFKNLLSLQLVLYDEDFRPNSLDHVKALY